MRNHERSYVRDYDRRDLIGSILNIYISRPRTIRGFYTKQLIININWSDFKTKKLITIFEGIQTVQLFY